MSNYIDRLSLRFAPDIREVLIHEALLQQEAERRKIRVTAADLDATVSKAYALTLSQFGDEKAMLEQLKTTRGWSREDYRTVIRMQAEGQVLREKLAAALVPAASVKEEELSKLYEERRDQFTHPESVRISHILIRRPAAGAGGASEEQDRKAREKAEAILKKVIDGGATAFEAAARESSDDRATGAKGGKVPSAIVRGANPFGAAFEANVFSAPIGLVRQVIPSPGGYHIIRVDAKQEGRTLPLADVREQLRMNLVAERRDRAVDELLLRLRTQAKVQVGKF